MLALRSALCAGRLADRSDSVAVWVGAAGLLVVAGVYQLSPLEGPLPVVSAAHRCTSCMRVGAYRGVSRHVRAGAYHGAFCVGCCWSLMVALIALGIMNLGWMVAFTVVITLEKLWRHGSWVAIAAGVGLIVLGLLAPWHPGLVPGLHPSPMTMAGM